jgi:hypothetical protein
MVFHEIGTRVSQVLTHDIVRDEAGHKTARATGMRGAHGDLSERITGRESVFVEARFEENRNSARLAR